MMNPDDSRRRNMQKAVSTVVRNKRGRSHGAAAIKDAKRRGVAVINHGAGTMPVHASAPNGGERYASKLPSTVCTTASHQLCSSTLHRYTLLSDPPEGPDDVPLKAVDSHDGKRRDQTTNGLLFEGNLPACKLFTPVLTPQEMIRAGVFGGCYFHPRGGKPGIFGRDVAVTHKELPSEWLKGVDEENYNARRYNRKKNKYLVKSGNDQMFWESKGWIHEQDPRGWFQWS